MWVGMWPFSGAVQLCTGIYIASRVHGLRTASIQIEYIILCVCVCVCLCVCVCGLGSSVGIATELRAGRSGIEIRWRRDFPPVQTGPGAHPAFCTMGTASFPGVKCGRGVLLTTHPLLVPRSWKNRAIPLGHTGPATGTLYLYLYITTVWADCTIFES